MEILACVPAGQWCRLAARTVHLPHLQRYALLRVPCKSTATDTSEDEKGLPESMVALLFMVGFLAGGTSASFAGTIADRFGRKAGCLAYCIIYSCSCLTLLTDRIEVLFLGRILGGIAGTLLYSVFESWLVAEFNRLMVDDEGSSLSGIFSMMTTLNSFVAIVAGIAAGWLVDHVGTAKAPFMASMGCMAIAFLVISNTWVRSSSKVLWMYY